MNREEVTAVACDYRDRVLEYLRGNTEDPEVEKHLEECGECRALVEGYLEKEKELDIPEAGYGGTDEGLKERVVHFEKEPEGSWCSPWWDSCWAGFPSLILRIPFL